MIVQDRVARLVRVAWKPLLGLFALDCVVTVLYVGYGWTWIAIQGLPLPLIGTGLALFLGLRNNTAYSRWWEARTLWGAVTNQSRSFARTVLLMLPDDGDEELRTRLVQHQIAWAHALRASLRREDAKADASRHLPSGAAGDIEDAGNLPFTIQRRITRELAEARDAGRLDTIQLAAFNTVLSALTDAQGGLERINNTPMPRQFASLPRIFVFLYCIILPFGVVGSLGIYTPAGSTLIGLLFFAFGSAGRDLEDPFERSAHELPMSAITRTIEIDLKQALGRLDRPEPMRPVLGVLR